MKSYVCVFTKDVDTFNCNLQLQELKTTLEDCFINKINEDFSYSKIDEAINDSIKMGFDKFVLLSQEKDTDILTDALREEYGNKFQDIYALKENFERALPLEETGDIYPIKEDVEKELSILARLNEEETPPTNPQSGNPQTNNGGTSDNGGQSDQSPQPQEITTISKLVNKITGYFKNGQKVAGSVKPFSFLVPKDITAYSENPDKYNEFKEYLCPDIKDLNKYFNTEMNKNIQIAYEQKKDTFVNKINGKDTWKPSPTLWKSLQNIEYFKGNRYFRKDGSSVHPVYSKIKDIFKAAAVNESDNYTSFKIRSIIFDTITEMKISKYIDAIMEKFIKVNKDAVVNGRLNFSKKGNLGDGIYCLEDIIVAFSPNIMESSKNITSDIYIQTLTAAITRRTESVISKFIRYKEEAVGQLTRQFDIKSFNEALKNVNTIMATGSVCKALVPIKASTQLPAINGNRDENPNKPSTYTDAQTGNLKVTYNVIVLPTGAISDNDCTRIEGFKNEKYRYVVFDDNNISPLVSKEIVKGCLSNEKYEKIKDLYDSALIDPETKAPLTISSFLYSFPNRVWNEVCSGSKDNFAKIQEINLSIKGFSKPLDEAKINLENTFSSIVKVVKGSENNYNKSQNNLATANFNLYNPLKINVGDLKPKENINEISEENLAKDNSSVVQSIVQEISKNDTFSDNLSKYAKNIISIAELAKQQNLSNLRTKIGYIVASKKCFYKNIEKELSQLLEGIDENVSKTKLLNLNNSDEYKEIVNKAIGVYSAYSENSKYIGIQNSLIAKKQEEAKELKKSIDSGNLNILNTIKVGVDLLFGDIARNMVINPFKDFYGFLQEQLEGTLTGAIISTVSKIAKGIGGAIAQNKGADFNDKKDKKDEELKNTLLVKLKGLKKEGFVNDSEEVKDIDENNISPEQFDKIVYAVLNSYKGLLINETNYQSILKFIIKNNTDVSDYKYDDFKNVIEAIKSGIEAPIPLPAPNNGNPPTDEQGQGGN